jgi:hypothetical protein
MSNGVGIGRIFHPYDWYWLADDARLFSSATQSLVQSTDPNYITWTEGGPATAWPRDNAGNQTDPSLQDVLTPYNLFATPQAAAYAELMKSIDGGFTTTGVASAPSGMPTMSAQYNRTEINIARGAAIDNTSYTTTWLGADGVGYPLTNAELKGSLYQALNTHMNAAYTTYFQTAMAIKEGKIKTVDEAKRAFGKFQRGWSFPPVGSIPFSLASSPPKKK